MKLLSVDSSNNVVDVHAAFTKNEYFLSDEELSSVKRVFSLLKRQRDKIANNNLDTQVDTFELEKNLKHN